MAGTAAALLALCRARSASTDMAVDEGALPAAAAPAPAAEPDAAPPAPLVAALPASAAAWDRDAAAAAVRMSSGPPSRDGKKKARSWAAAVTDGDASCEPDSVAVCA